MLFVTSQENSSQTPCAFNEGIKTGKEKEDDTIWCGIWYVPRQATPYPIFLIQSSLFLLSKTEDFLCMIPRATETNAQVKL